MPVPRQIDLNLEELLAETDITQSWRASDQSSGTRYFLRRPRPHSDRSGEVATLLSQSFANQARIKSQRVVTALSLRGDTEAPHVVYPFMDPNEWRVLTPTTLQEHLACLLTEISITLDYLHLNGLVHADLKLDNFLVRESPHGLQVRLIDLDYLSEDGARPHGMVIGTPGHIAPEILHNEHIMCQSDAYSLGTCIATCHTAGGCEPKADFNSVAIKVGRLAEHLTKEDPYSRPLSLVDSLLAHGLIDEVAHKEALRRLFGVFVLGGFRRHRATGLRPVFVQLLGEEFRTFGLPQELLAQFDISHTNASRSTFRVVRELLASSETALFGLNWQIRTSDDAVLESYHKLANGHTNGASKGESLSVDQDYVELEKEARSDLKGERALLSYLNLSRQIGRNGDSLGIVPVEAQSSLLQLLAEAAGDLGRPAEALTWMEQALKVSRRCGDSTANVVGIAQQVARLAAASGDLSRALQVARDGLKLAKRDGTPSDALEFRRLCAWIVAALGKIEEAEKELHSVIEDSKHCANHFVIAKAYNDLGTLSWRKGDFTAAVSSYKASLALQVRHGLEGIQVRSHAGLAMAHYELAEHEACASHCLKALQDMKGGHQKLAFESACSYLVLSLSLLGRFAEAEQWLQRFLRDKKDPRDNTFYGYYYSLLGRLRLDQGRPCDADVAFRNALHILGESTPNRFTAKAFQSLAEVALFRGEAELFRQNIARARTESENLGDRASLSELRCLETLYSFCYEPATDQGGLFGSLEELMSIRSYISVQQALPFVLLEAAPQEFERTVEVCGPLLAMPNQSPAHQALRELVIWRRAGATGFEQPVGHLKRALQLSEQAGMRFLVGRICMTLASYYAAQRRGRIGVRFLQHAERIARSLGNRVLLADLERRKKQLLGATPSERGRIDAFQSVSTILSHIGNPDEAFRLVVEYAMNETGAERGVLLLRSVDSEELQVRAAVNCDGPSLKDIESISKSVPLNVLESGVPVVFGDVMRDQAFAKYKSIFVHNILSILCVPVTQERARVGVLYLDHHTVPSLFDDTDLDFVRSAAGVVSALVTTTVNVAQTRRSRDQLKKDLQHSSGRDTVIAQSPAMLELLGRLTDIAGSRATILLLGETGVGKDVIANYIHRMSPRSEAPIIPINCSAFGESMVDSELFGVVDKAASGVGAREGRFAAADGGTLFMDEIGDMSPSTQARVLRTLENGTYEKVGSNRTLRTDVRVIAASNKDLAALVETGQFRKDLYYRINTFPITIPPLRERLEDISALAEHFAMTFANSSNPPLRFSVDTMGAMLTYQWPGNVRELRNLVEKLTVLHAGKVIQRGQLPEELLRGSGGTAQTKAMREEHDKRQLIQLLKKHRGNKSSVARELGIAPSTLIYRMRKYGIS